VTALKEDKEFDSTRHIESDKPRELKNFSVK